MAKTEYDKKKNFSKNARKLQNLEGQYGHLEGQYGHLEGQYGHFTKKRVIFVVLFQDFDFDPLVLYCTNIVALE